MMRRGLGLVVMLLLIPGRASAANITLTFDEAALKNDNNDPILNFYNGGKTYLGIGPGPNYGVSFVDDNARVFTQTSRLIGTFTKPGIMQLYSDTAREGQGISTTMNVSGGFAGTIAFDYAAIDSAGMIQIYSGLNGKGTLLSTVKLPVTSPVDGPGTFVSDSATFSGVAHSAVFSGGNKQLGIDDFQFSSVPEPSSGLMLLSGVLLCSVAAHSRWRWSRGL